jgi:predicted permease
MQPPFRNYVADGRTSLADRGVITHAAQSRPAVAKPEFVGAIIFPVLVALLEIDRPDASRDLRGAALIRQIATNPVILAKICRVTWSIVGVTLPGPVASFPTIPGEALTPCALFSIELDLTLNKLSQLLRLFALPTVLELAIVLAVDTMSRKQSWAASSR